jgi:hypothetical protein
VEFLVEQEVLRAKLNTYIFESGIKAKFIAQRINVDESILCRFRKGLKDLYPENLKSLKQYLEK